MKCLLSISDSGFCELLNKIKEVNEVAYREARKLVGTADFFKNYCSWCIKSLYAMRFKTGKYTVVSTL